MEICSLVSEKNGNKHTDRQTNRHTNIGFTKESFSAPLGPIPTLCPNFMEISSLVSEKNGNKQTYIQTSKQMIKTVTNTRTEKQTDTQTSDLPKTEKVSVHLWDQNPPCVKILWIY